MIQDAIEHQIITGRPVIVIGANTAEAVRLRSLWGELDWRKNQKHSSDRIVQTTATTTQREGSDIALFIGLSQRVSSSTFRSGFPIQDIFIDHYAREREVR